MSTSTEIDRVIKGFYCIYSSGNGCDTCKFSLSRGYNRIGASNLRTLNSWCGLHHSNTLGSLLMVMANIASLLWKTDVDAGYSGQQPCLMGWVGLWGFLWWAPSGKRKHHQGVSSGWSSVWRCSNTGLSSTQYEQIPIILGVWPFWLTPFFRSITFWWAYG